MANLYSIYSSIGYYIAHLYSIGYHITNLYSIGYLNFNVTNCFEKLMNILLYLSLSFKEIITN